MKIVFTNWVAQKIMFLAWTLIKAFGIIAGLIAMIIFTIAITKLINT